MALGPADPCMVTGDRASADKQPHSECLLNLEHLSDAGSHIRLTQFSCHRCSNITGVIQQVICQTAGEEGGDYDDVTVAILS